MVLVEIVQSVFTAAWGFFSDVMVPGLGVSFGSLLIALILIKLSVAIFHAVTGSGGSGYRSGSSGNPKISDERKDDEF